MVPTLPHEVYSDNNVIVVLLILIFALLLWNTRRNIRLGERLVKVETVLFNHFSHRFDKVRAALGLEWDDDLKSEESEETPEDE